MERATAILAVLYAKVHGNDEASLYDFAPYEDEPPLTLDDAIDTWR